VPLAAAEGAILAHGLRLPDARFKKGRVLRADDVAALRAAGIERVVAARLEPGDVPEDAAAGRLAAALAGDGVRAGAAFTGRCNLHAERAGLLLVDAARVDRLNLVDESLTVATLAAPAPVDEKQMLATVKVIPFAVPGGCLERCEAIARDGGPMLRLAPFVRRRAGLVQTRLEHTRESVLDKTARVLGRRMAALGGEIVREVRCAHDEQAVAAAVRDLLDGGAGAPAADRIPELIMVSGASAIVDRRDVVPAGIMAAGGAIVHFGMPVDPGNLLLLAEHGDVPVLGLPGCARSPKFNGLDEVLERLAAGLAVSGEEIMGMGVGGLLKEIETRPQPRSGREPGGRGAGGARAPRVAALVLAAGRSRRMGRDNKLLAEVDGTPMVARVADEVLRAGVAPVVVVTGHERGRVERALADRVVRLVHNPDHERGLSTSLAAGLRALPAQAEGVLVCLGDMPRVRVAHVERLLAAFDPLEGRAICVPTCRGKRGNPVLFARRFFEAMGAIEGDVGARHLIGENAEDVCEVEMADDGVLLDVDTAGDLEALAAGATTSPDAPRG